MFWFEYNFLFVLAAKGAADKSALGDHSPVGYEQRARFYAISDEGRLAYAKQVAGYLCFLCLNTGLSDLTTVEYAQKRLEGYQSYAEMLDDIA